MFIVYPDYFFNLFSVCLSAFKQKVLPEWYLGPYQKTMVSEVALKPSVQTSLQHTVGSDRL